MGVGEQPERRLQTISPPPEVMLANVQLYGSRALLKQVFFESLIVEPSYSGLVVASQIQASFWMARLPHTLHLLFVQRNLPSQSQLLLCLLSNLIILHGQVATAMAS